MIQAVLSDRNFSTNPHISRGMQGWQWSALKTILSTSGNGYTWHKQNSEVIKESVSNFEAQLEEDIDQDSGFVTEVMHPERWINKTIAGRRKTLLLKKNEDFESESEHSPSIWGFP